MGFYLCIYFNYLTMKNHFNTRKIAVVGMIISATSFNAVAKADWHYARSSDYINQRDSLTTAQFLQQTAIAGMKEVSTGKLAAEKATDQKIKAFGQMMVDDHSKANEELRSLAKLKKVNLPMSRPEGELRPDGRVDSSPENMKDTSRTKNAGGEAGNTGLAKKIVNGATEADVANAIEKLNKLSGASFDKAYVEMMITDHQNAVALFEKASKSTDNDVKAYANKYLPVLKKHLKQVNALAVK
ncbi:putative membrane protein [Flavobacterium sp. W4I14]|nr:putative membrane protein [Flavobacterium sp. W4I14]